MTGSDDLLAAKRAFVELDRELARLPEGQREVFELLRGDGLSLAEVAQNPRHHDQRGEAAGVPRPRGAPPGDERDGRRRCQMTESHVPTS